MSSPTPTTIALIQALSTFVFFSLLIPSLLLYRATKPSKFDTPPFHRLPRLPPTLRTSTSLETTLDFLETPSSIQAQGCHLFHISIVAQDPIAMDKDVQNTTTNLGTKT
ncbi:uncharacterized protein BDZ99DRAFT_522337 [Mytilinidion resinicola]|uniref:Uncharacterized protein n=1 Tax=Mytilinidion resinicola TaxID=574789 RepID=A0A6A6YGJ4_9PEZI|nr:uncharacterized protein BDZ99DRAFT_522337 [Mytilinidion resinicola]KAF2807719.1 hypothetical protein BDZ99DRAFT_522337 [Mytilinidion resinicola]